MALDDDQRNWRVIGVVLIVIVLGSAAYVGLGTNVSKILSTVGASVGGGSDAGNGGDSEPAAGGGSDGPAGGPSVPLYSSDRADLLIVKTGTLALQVRTIDPALADATNVVTSLSGYASASDRTGDGDDLAAKITFRIPAAKWEAAFVRLRAIGDRVLGEHSETEDVTGQVVDLGARIRNLEATERALQSIMDRAGVIKDVLTVQAELTTTRGQIEELTAQMTHLEEQAALSTLTVTFTLKPAPVLTMQQAQFDPGGEAERASASLVSVLQAVATAGIWFGIVWLPILLFVAIVGGVLLVVARRLRRAGPGGDLPIEPATEGGT